MCGIIALINNKNNTQKNINECLENGKNRGPEFTTSINTNNIFFGFHRLAINGLNEKSNQPFKYNDCILICNGEIYNFKQLAYDNLIELNTDSDCEIIIHIYKLYGIEYTLSLLDGVFSFILYDINKDIAYISRDPYGVRPLYYYYENNCYGFASELKCLYSLCINKKNIKNFPPGTYFELTNINNTELLNKNIEKKYTNFMFGNTINDSDIIYKEIVNKLTKAVKKRVIGTTDRPIACLLSGGLDSSLIACLVNKFLKEVNPNKKLKTFSIGLPGSEDLKYAKIVATHINSDHHEIIVSEDDFFNAIPEVIKTIESYDTTTVRASVGNYLVAKYIKENSDCKVIFNGDGADELMGGYLYFKHAPTKNDFDNECKRLLNDIHMFDVLRSDKSISSNGLEPRTPFLDREWVEFYLSINKELRYVTTIDNCEKYLIRQAFNKNNKNNNKLLPDEILWRTKEAFSDGVSSLNKSWFEIINEKIDKINDNNMEYNIINTGIQYKKSDKYINIPQTREQCYYRYLFNKHYSGCDSLIEYFWMPKFVNAKDASARTLNVYKKNNTNSIDIQ